ncbi:ribosomal protein S8 [Mycoplasma haemofelis str. Langford 1]|uniref:Small ribosomal subunit protein uS8 n=2 Tax=Mycoplasma haemofelis TaxID=29501 RepID=F6FHC2_MYCHI|nr:30S ribosomal protein S8 [Mycoplasma haemofelis]AEG73752.1 30S ribosomal S8 [Mycoplasma haemofelis Ohio2]CBY93456.1 ribosomal protein S8 [Mycoplasma haemofelis str. Langford 1]
MITDPIANVVCQINNAIRVRKKEATFYSSKVIKSILQILEDEGYIEGFVHKTSETGISVATIFFKYKDGVSAIRGIKRVSKPGYRVYCKAKNLPIVMNGMGTAIISTNQNVMGEKESRKLNLGGEVLLHIW